MLPRIITVGLLIISPLLLGSNRAIFWAFNGFAVSLGLLAFALSEWPNRMRYHGSWQLPLYLILALTLPALWMIIQASSWTPRALHHPIWNMLPVAEQTSAAISINPSLTWATLAWWMTTPIAIVAMSMGSRQRPRIILNVIVAMALVEAVLGFIVIALKLDTVGLLPKIAYRDWLTGTFVNRNSSASFLAIGLIAVVTLAAKDFSEIVKVHPTASLLSRLIVGLGHRFGFLLAIAIVLFAAILSTGSRGGALSSIIGIAAVAFLNMRGGALFRAGTAVALFALFGTLVAVALTAIVGRGQEALESSAARISLFKETLKAIADRPLLGHGAGTYQDVEPLYHLPGTASDVVWNNAHSTILEAFACFGVPATLLFLALAVTIFYRLYVGRRDAGRSAIGTTAALATALCLGFHSLVDFNLEVNAIVLYLCVLVGVAVGEIMHMSPKERRWRGGQTSMPQN